MPEAKPPHPDAAVIALAEACREAAARRYKIDAAFDGAGSQEVAAATARRG